MCRETAAAGRRYPRDREISASVSRIASSRRSVPVPFPRTENLMSRLIGVSLSAVVLVALASGVRAADDPKDIIAKAIKAHGGEEFLTKNQAGHLKSKGKITIPGIGETDFT